MKQAIYTALLFLTFAPLVFCAEFRRAETFEDAADAGCRVSVANARGSGCFVGYDKEHDRCVVLTNYHVVTTNSAATLTFWPKGRRTSIPGTVFARFYNAQAPFDFALIAADPASMERIGAPFVALGGKDASPAKDSYIISAGAPKGRNVAIWKGRVLDYYNGSTIEFQPAPVPGQSGSAIVSEVDGALWVTGILTWLIGTEGSDESKGGAIPISNLYRAIGGKTGAADVDFSPIPPGATECAAPESPPYIVEITQDNCPPCLAAQTDADAISAAGFTVAVFNASTEEGAAQARSLNVKKTPTFILFNANGEEQSRYEGAGHGAAIVDAARALTPPPSSPAEPSDLDLTDLLPEPESPPVVQDFRARPNVSETTPGRSPTGFFEDSAGRWTDRARGANPGADHNQGGGLFEKKTPKTENDGNAGGVFGNRLNERLAESFSQKIGAQLDGAINKADGALTGALDKAGARLDAKLEEEKQGVSAWWNKTKWRILGFLFLVLTAAVFVGGALLRVGRVLRRWVLCSDILEERLKEEEGNEKKE